MLSGIRGARLPLLAGTGTWIKRSDSHNLYLQNFVGQASVNLARKVVSAHGKIRLFNQRR